MRSDGGGRNGCVMWDWYRRGSRDETRLYRVKTLSRNKHNLLPQRLQPHLEPLSAPGVSSLGI